MPDEKDLQDRASWIMEEARQAQILSRAIDEAIARTTRTFATPILNALAGAVVASQAKVLAVLADDPEAREGLQLMMARSLPIALEAQLRVQKEGGGPELIIVEQDATS